MPDDHWSRTRALLCGTLEAGVPLAIVELHHRGGPTDQDRDRARDWGQMLAEKGDQLLFPGKDTAALMTMLIHSIAVLAFCPGGVTLFGAHWEAQA